MRPPLLYLTHRLPYPPNKGDKITTFHLLRHLAARYDVYLGTFVDAAEDDPHRSALTRYCAALHAPRLRPRLATIGATTGFVRGEALTLSYYRSRAMTRWVERIVRTHGIARAVVYSSAMAQYVQHLAGLHTVLHFADVDSAKWSDYANAVRWPLSAVYRREARTLLAFERAAARRAAACSLVTDAEAALFARLAPECASKVCVVRNGVDTDYFAPLPERASPFACDEVAIVFTGVMDYRPNIDAVDWFAREVLPALLTEQTRLRFYIVGMNPAPAVRALTRDRHVVVTGKVPDVRPYLQHARVVVAPLRIARGVQNKVLEAMAMQRPVVVAAAAAVGVSGVAGEDFAVAGTAAEFVAKVKTLLDVRAGDALGMRARACVLRQHAWDANLTALTDLLEAPAPVATRPQLTEALA